MPDSFPNGTGSALGKALAVLEVLLDEPAALSLGDIAARTDLPRQTVHRMVKQLEENALLRREPGGDSYSVGPRMVDLGVQALTASARGAPVRRVLENLVARLGETCNLGVLARDEVVYVERVECDWPLRIQYHVGSRVPLHATGIGKLLLAHLPARERRRLLRVLPLTRLTERTITDPAGLEEELTAIRRRGYAANDQENTPGLIGLAVPIRKPSGRVIAGLAVHAPEARLPMKRALEHLPALNDAARELEAFFAEDLEGLRPPAPAAARTGSRPAADRN
ncbi:MAG: IclR family transcriptional regulator [Rhodospirillales bacterium CG15_BIG_FIL_POST_REV_8_21_14_020_66_15]|nr:MAG: IclR family transcriptional regulator [Rhodospirillales bacterium CG15_BIG_FIL_POST_REV_8_21_14_020_66_15]